VGSTGGGLFQKVWLSLVLSQPASKVMLEAGELAQVQQEIDDGGQADKDVGGDKGAAQDVGGEVMHHFHPDFHLQAKTFQLLQVH